jgi:tripartite-type tricarboxylate transporter receptor subunit TctC
VSQPGSRLSGRQVGLEVGQGSDTLVAVFVQQVRDVAGFAPVPAGVPKPIIDRLHLEIMKILQTAEMQERLKALGMQPSSMSPDQVSAFQKTEVEKWAQVIRAAGIKLE